MAIKKYAKLGLFPIIGCVLLTFGFGFAFYNDSLVANPNTIYYLTLENNYTANAGLQLNIDDRLAVHVSPFNKINYSINLINGNSTILIKNSSEIQEILLIQINSTDSYIIQIKENQPYQYTQIVLEIIISLSQPNYPLIMLSIPLIIFGAILTLIGFREIDFFRKKLELYYKFEVKEIALIIASILTFIITYLLLSRFLIDIVVQDWLMVSILVFTSIINLILVYQISIYLRENKLRIYSIILLILSYIWAIGSFILINQSTNLVFNSISSGPINNFNILKNFLTNYANLYFQTIFFVLIIPLVYISISYSQGRSALIVLTEKQEKIKTETLDKNLGLLKDVLITPLKKGDLIVFFNKLSKTNLEASSTLFIFLREYITDNINQFTYHKLITEYKDLFNKKIYERKPVEYLLEPLGYVNKAEGRFKIFSLNLKSDEVKRMIELFLKLKQEANLKKLEESSGILDLEERKIRFSGLS